MLATNKLNRIHAFIGITAFIVVEIFLVNMVDKHLAYTTKELDLSYPHIIDFFRILTKLGLSKWYQWPSGICTVLLFAAYFMFGKKAHMLGDEARKKLLHVAQAFLFVFTSSAVAGIIANVFKVLIGRARPKLLFIDGTFGFDPFIVDPDWDAMPSGHSTTVFAIAASMIVLFPRSRPYAIAFAFVLGLSRIMVNAHYLSDVLFGLVIGVGMTKIVENWFREKGILFGATQKW